MTITAAHVAGYRTGTWKLDPAHSEIAFSVRHLAISKVKGVFEQFDVTVVAPEDPADATVEATIEIASVNTKQAQRDQHLRTSDFFAADEHPQMRFRSTALHAEEDGDFVLDGELTLRGVTRPVSLKGEFGGIVTDGYGQTKAGVEAKTKIDRHDFGVSWNAAIEAGGMTLGDEVTITFDLQFVLS
ncbi:YceI family protein [Amnibacterium setariae]|uniref:Polyisoprenoid-binding protein n=1 Tax=Amnibacterium setariae TaxID=2306585 RepID=A0A3A1TYB1_9MICO|nr:YceI family protein [Amnibacterium setariae]RIX28571.1 polyisoprenoid-binding protein [Amnibacterium setariae]